jgi:hypothetical protein
MKLNKKQKELIMLFQSLEIPLLICGKFITLLKPDSSILICGDKNSFYMYVDDILFIEREIEKNKFNIINLEETQYIATVMGIFMSRLHENINEYASIDNDTIELKFKKDVYTLSINNECVLNLDTKKSNPEEIGEHFLNYLVNLNNNSREKIFDNKEYELGSDEHLDMLIEELKKKNKI